MRVWLWQEKEYGEVGDRRWLVEWYTVTPSAKGRVETNEAAGKEDEYDYDRDIELNKRSFPPKGEGFGRGVCEADGWVSIDETPAGYGEWVDVGDAIDV